MIDAWKGNGDGPDFYVPADVLIPLDVMVSADLLLRRVTGFMPQR